MDRPGRRKPGDRRNQPRYDIVGELWGTLETVVTTPLMNVAPGGLLVESRVPLPPASMHRLVFASNGENIPAQVCVRHVRPSTTSLGERCFLIGLEFVSVQPALAEHLTQLMGVARTATT